MVDYSAYTPLWIRGRNVVDLAPLNLAPDLADALIAWQRHFDAHFSIERGPSWDELAAAEWHNSEGPRLYERLTRALPGADITLDMWVPAT
jgi:hypothetical protein